MDFPLTLPGSIEPAVPLIMSLLPVETDESTVNDLPHMVAGLQMPSVKFAPQIPAAHRGSNASQEHALGPSVIMAAFSGNIRFDKRVVMMPVAEIFSIFLESVPDFHVNQPFTAPAVMPEMILSCMKIYTSTVGIMVSTIAAYSPA